MGQKKLIRFEAIKSFPNVLQYPEGMAGQWAAFFKNGNPLTLELACGKGEYTVGLARMYPQRNFLGVDMKGNRLYIGAKKCLEEGINNAAFLRTHIDKITSYFHKGEVEEIWLTFPDPQLRKSRATRRLTHPKFIRFYQQILQPGGRLHLKTDSPVLYDFTKWVADMYNLGVVEDSADIHAGYAGPLKEELTIRTHYESLDIAQSKKVHYLCLTLPEGPLPDRDAELLERIKNEEPTPPARVMRPPRIIAPSGVKTGRSGRIRKAGRPMEYPQKTAMKELIEGVDFYYNEQGLMVLTEKYHLTRGYCCGNGCRHCPFEYERVSEPLRSQLIEQRKNNGNIAEE